MPPFNIRFWRGTGAPSVRARHAPGCACTK